MKKFFSIYCFFIILFGAAKSQAQTTNCDTVRFAYTDVSYNYYCPGTPIYLSLQLGNIPNQTGLTFQWQKSNNGIAFISMPNDTLSTDTITQSVTTYYRCIIGCRYSSSIFISNPVIAYTIIPTGPCYCTSMPYMNDAQNIFNVQFGALQNVSTCTSTATNGSTGPIGYSNYTSLPAVSYNILQTYPIHINLGMCNSSYYSTFVQDKFSVYIDYNQDGDFADTAEVAFSYNIEADFRGGDNYYNSNFYNNSWRNGYITIPSFALTGNTRMRIVINGGSSSIQDYYGCGHYTYGETEDYTINIQAPPLTFLSCNAIQKLDSATHGTNNKQIMRVPVAVTGAGYSIISKLIFNTSGTTDVSNIINAKLYRTDTSKVFNTSKLLGTIASPNGSFVFNVNDTLVNYDTTNYWLAYDISQTSNTNNVLDAKLDSINVNGIYRMSIVNNPIGNVIIATPMSFISSNVTQNYFAKVNKGTKNNRILGIEITATGMPIYLNSINISTNGTTDTNDIRNLKIWYTGNKNSFDTSIQYGSTIVLPLASQSISSNVFLKNGTNYFWVTYDIASNAITSNVIDAECTSFIFDGSIKTPSVTAPLGNRVIIPQYCFCSSGTHDDDKISNVQFGNINNSSSCYVPEPRYNSTKNQYSDFTNIEPSSFNKGRNYYIGISFNACYGGHSGPDVGVYIDFNQDGDFNDSSENVLNTTSGWPYGPSFASGIINIPSFAHLGETRMRVVAISGYSGYGTYPCGTYTWGETEDYTINIIRDTLEYLGSTAKQSTGIAWTGTSNHKVLRVPITMGGSGVAMANKLYFNTKGTNRTSNISAAKLYRTENRANFDTSHLVASIINPNGAMVFNINDTLLNNDTTNYWLCYDVKPNAILLDTLDATFDSLEVLGSIQKPTESNPSGNLIINTMMKFLNATTTQNVVKRVYPNTLKLQVLGITVNTSSIGVPLAIDSLTIGTNGTSNLTDIRNLRIWYTGNNNVFDTTYQYGATVSVPSLTQNVKSNLLLANGANYFWVTYDVKATATISNLIDAECTSISIDGSTKIPSITAPAGNIRIRTDYCFSSAQITNSQEITNVKFGGLNNASSCVSITPGVGSVDRLYSNFTALPAATFYKGISYNLAVTINSCNAVFGAEAVAAYIDYNQDGLFTGIGENVYTSAYASGSANQVRGGDIIIPNNVDTGLTRLRIVYNQNTNANPCGAYSNGETEDYTINLQECPVYFWTGAVSTDFAVPANWQPNRNTILPVDKLVFSSGGNISVTNVQNQSVSSLTIDSNSQVSLTASAINVLSISDTLFLTNGAIIGSSNLILSIGTDTIKTGSLIGNGAYKDGTMRRWINKNMGDIIFPMYSGANNRSIKINYSTQPNVSGYLKAQFINTKPINNGLPLNESGILVKRAGINGYWALTATTLSGGVFSTTLNGDGFNGITDPTKLVLLRRATNASVWQLHGNHVTSWGSNSSPIVSRTGMSSYGNFGIGGDTLVNSLPVSMLYFSVEKVNENALLTWATSSEQNNDGFEIEKNTDINSYDWRSIGFVKGNGTTNLISKYQFTDNNIQSANKGLTLYYRLRQIDFNGHSSYSKILSLGLDSDDEDVKVYPNPFHDEININFSKGQGIDSKIELFNCLGDAMPVSIVLDKYNSNAFTLSNLSHLSNGVYFLKINNRMIKVIR